MSSPLAEAMYDHDDVQGQAVSRQEQDELNQQQPIPDNNVESELDEILGQIQWDSHRNGNSSLIAVKGSISEATKSHLITYVEKQPPKLTSEDWSRLIDSPSWQILDPDGWDRNNFQYSWHEERITANEFRKRAMMSTGQWPIKDHCVDRLVEKYGDVKRI